MGKLIITQRRGKGSSTYRASGHRVKGRIKNKSVGTKESNGVVKSIINSRGHSAPLLKVDYKKEKVLIPAPYGIKEGDEILTGENVTLSIGNTLPLKNIPEGTQIYNVESKPGKPTFCRSAGTFAKVIAKFPDRVVINLPSKKRKSLNPNCRATIGIVAGGGRKEKPFVKAGKKYHAMGAKGRLYPRTSGVAMNAVDHPFGSGRGRHIGKPKTAPRNAPPGRNVGLIKARRTGKRK